MTLEQFSQITGLARNTIARVERDETRHVDPRILGRLLPQFASRFKEAFPESGGDPYDFLIPPKTLGAWLKNQRLRLGMPQKNLAKTLGVHAYTIIRYESNRTKPDKSVRRRLRALLGDGFEPFLERATI